MKVITKKISSNAVAVILLTAAAFGLGQVVPTPHTEAAPAVDHALAPTTAPAGFADVIEAVKPAVVNISSSAPAGSRFAGPGPGMPFPEGAFPGGPSMEEFFRRFFKPQSGTPSGDGMPEVRSMGSGFIVDPEGLVVTNNHVIEGASEIVVTLNDGTRFPAELVGRDPKTDLALLRIDAELPLPHADFGDSDSARAGDWVIAIGNPFGLGGTATTGIVSARGRDIQSGPFDNFLQIDAPINRGNSGGPLFDTTGKVIGVNTAIFSPNGGNVGIGFAIPASQVAPIVEQLRTDGHVERGWLGVQIQQIDDDIAAGLGIENTHGALVARVVEDSPAQSAGLRPGDVIVRFEDHNIETIKDLTRQVAAIPPDSAIELEVWRDGDTMTFEVDLGENPEDVAIQAGGTAGEGDGSAAGLGLSMLPLTPENRQRYGVEDEVEGALVAGVAPGSPAAHKGLRPGDVILRVGQEAVSVRLKRLPRSSPFRLAVAYVALFGSSALVLMAFIYGSTAGYMLRQADNTIEAEIVGLAERYRIAGLTGLTALIEDRLQRGPSGSSLYLVTDAAGRIVVGNLSAWPQVQPDEQGWLDFRLGTGDDDPIHSARAKPFRLRGGFHLLAGRDMYELQAIRSRIARTMTWGLVLVIFLALVGGVLVSRGRIRRVGIINEAIADVVAGDLTRRIPPDPTGDDIEQLVDNLNGMLHELEKLVDGVRRVSDNIAHDLRTPLARLKNRLETLRQRVESRENREIVENAVAEADGLLDTFNALLRIARIESGSRRQAFTAVRFGPLIDDVAELYAPLLEEAGLELGIEHQADLELSGDRDLLFQALANLVDNTLKYVPSGGRVNVIARREGDVIRIAVSDDGPGISATERGRVLERFHRLDSSRSTPGAGLGLSLVAAVAELHHARLELQDNDPGLRVELRFPARRHRTPVHLSAEVGESPGRSSAH